MRRVVVVILCSMLMSSLSGCFWAAKSYKKHPSLSPYDGSLQIPGLRGEVNVYRDEYGIPHIFADNEHDLFFAVGYVQAQDRLWEMVFFRAFAEGRMSELFGYLNVPGAEFKGFPMNTVGIDTSERLMGMKFLGQAGAALMKERRPDVYNQVASYCDGVNAFIDSHQEWKELPVEFQVLKTRPDRWKPEDVFSFGRFMGFFLGYNMMAELLRYAIAEKYGEDLAWEIGPIHGSTGPTIIPKELLKNKLDRPRDLPPGGRPSREELGYELPRMHADAAFDLLAFQKNLRTLSGMPEPFASNNWVISGKLTEDGNAMLGNDPHLPHIQPSIWYMMHIKGAGYDSIGSAFPGTPFTALGHTPKLGWAATTSIADVQDLFIETVDKDHPGMYKYKGEWRPFTVREETIKVRVGSGYINKKIEIRQSIHGPIINDMLPLPKDTPPMAMRWVAWDFSRNLKVYEALIGSTSVDEFMRKIKDIPDKDIDVMGTAISMSILMKAESVDDFVKAMDKLDLPSQNWVAADSAGNIAYLPGGLVPIRNKGLGVMPVPGESGEFDWTGFIPLMELPYTINPERGYVVTGNNEVVDAEWYPYVFDLNYDSGWRAWRAIDLIKELAPISMDDMKQMQNDVKMKRAEIEVPLILKAVENKHVTDPRVLRGADELRKWDYRATVDSTATLIFVRYTEEVRKNILADEVDEKDFDKFLNNTTIDIMVERFVERGDSPLIDNKKTKNVVEDRDDMLVKSLDDAMAYVEKKYGKDPEKREWGKVHWIKFYHILGIGPLEDLSVGPFPEPGASHTLRCASPMGFGKVRYKSFNGTSFRHLVDMGDVNHAQMVFDGSVSGQWLSPHYKDLVNVWVQGQHTTQTMNPEEIKANAKYHMVLKP